jgi:chromosomal replication initiation ATPase DnaA
MTDLSHHSAFVDRPAAGNRGGDRLRLMRRTIATATAAALDVSARELHRATRGTAQAALARQVAMYVAHVSLGLSYRAAGRMFGRDRTTAAHACRIVEDRREDPLIDAQLLAIEQVCIALCVGNAVSGVRR